MLSLDYVLAMLLLCILLHQRSLGIYDTGAKRKKDFLKMLKRLLKRTPNYISKA
jgi:hypothetical protein